MKRFTTSLSLVMLMLLFLSSCKDDDIKCGCAPPFSSNLIGKWEWVKTITPSGEVITPQTVGHGKSLSYGNSAKVNGNYLYTTKDGETPIVLPERVFTDPIAQSGASEQWLTMQFGSKYIKLLLVKNSDNSYQEMIATDLIEDYSKGFGDTRHHYKRAGVPDKP